jgi:NTP pyrophosphatase (non-canonical NTP hydrolase)
MNTTKGTSINNISQVPTEISDGGVPRHVGAFDRLTNLQRNGMSVGYRPGEISVIALLGLMGEAGEVAQEYMNGIDTTVTDRPTYYLNYIQRGIDEMKRIDHIKKQIRDNKIERTGYLPSPDKPVDLEKFDAEMADVLYYLNALASNRGKSLEQYAQLSFDKVTAKIKQQNTDHQ